MSNNKTFVEGGYFVPLLGVIGAVIGIAIGSDGFSNLAYMTGSEILLLLLYTFGGIAIGILSALGIRRIL